MNSDDSRAACASSISRRSCRGRIARGCWRISAPRFSRSSRPRAISFGCSRRCARARARTSRRLNCGKKSLAIDLRQPEAQQLIRELAAKCDVVVENSRPGVMTRLGLDYATLETINPRIVYCSISGFGQTGPWAKRSAYAPMLHAASGFDLVNLSYQNGLERPLTAGIMVGDVLGGTYAFGAIQTALLARERTGRGDYIDLAMMDGMLGMLTYEFQEAQFPQPRRAERFSADAREGRLHHDRGGEAEQLRGVVARDRTS